MTGWALLVPAGHDIARAAAGVTVPVTTVVSDAATGLALVVSRDVAGLVVPLYDVLAPLVVEHPGPGGPDPTRRRPQDPDRPQWRGTRRTSRRPERLDRPRPHWRT